MDNSRIRPALAAASSLRPHEETDKARQAEILREILRHGGVHPLVVSEDFVVLDGHHRLACLKLLGVEKIPVFVVDYFGNGISVSPRRGAILVSKELVVKRAKSGRLFPHKTTRHSFGHALPCARIPLKRLAATPEFRA